MRAGAAVLVRVVRAALALVAIAALGRCGPAPRGNGLNVLLVSYETTRADHLGFHGYGRATSPRMDAIASRGVVFERMSAVQPRTNPSLASLHTAKYAHQHGVRNLFLPLGPENRTLAEALHDAGYRTLAVQTHPRLIAASGFAHGFDVYDDAFDEHPLADQACGAAVEHVRRAAGRERPWFLWLHLMDPHWTYDPPAPWRTAFGPDDPRPGELYRALAARRATIGPVIFRNRMPADEVAAFVRLYDGEIRFADEAVGNMLDALQASGQMDRTIVVFTSDHGESLGEHDYFFEHGDLGTEPEIHVPLVIVSPGRVPAGLRVPWTVSNVDVAPTILELLDLPPERSFRGSSLVPLLTSGGRGEDRPCFGETDMKMHEENDRREVAGVAGKWRWCRLGRFKLLHRPRTAAPAERVLFDLESDPGETRDATAEHRDVAARLGSLLDAWMADDRLEEREYRITDEARERLRALGYLN